MGCWRRARPACYADAPVRGRITENMTFDALWPLLVILTSAFGAATLLVLPSEAILIRALL